MHLHNNEQTALKVMQQFASDSLSTIHLLHGPCQYISFKSQRADFIFDPNRIFTEQGRKKTLKPLSSSSEKIDKSFCW